MVSSFLSQIETITNVVAKLNTTQVVPANLPAELAAQFATSGDERPLYRAELRALSTQVGAALVKSGDRETRAHLEGLRDQIARILDPKFAAPAAGTVGGIRIGFDTLTAAESCWPDYIINP